MSRPIWFRVITVLGSVIAVLIVLEVGLRIYVAVTDKEPSAQLQRAAGTMPPPRVGTCRDAGEQAGLGQLVQPAEAADVMYRLKPNVDTCYFGAPVQTNSQGFRASVDYARPKPAETYRIVLLGDSMAFGQGVAEGETFGEQLRAELERTRSGPVEVINMGVPGYNTAQEAASLAAFGMAYEPDCIIVLFIGNDFDLPEFLLKPRYPFALDRSFLLDTVLRREAGAKRYRGGVIHDQLFFTEGRPPDDRIPEEYRHLVGEAGYRRALKVLVDAAGTVPVVNFADFRAVAQESDVGALTEYQKQLGIVHPPFQYPEHAKYWLSATDQHFNAAGHRELAERMRAGLERERACVFRAER